MKHTFAPGRRHTRPLSLPLSAHQPVTVEPGVTPARSAGRAYVTRSAPPAVHADHILDAPAQDPYVVYVDGRYHYCESDAAGIFLRSAPTMDGLSGAIRRQLWAPPRRGACAKNVWAPEIHFIRGRWYVYFAADDGFNANHRMFVLVSGTSNIRSQYKLVGSLDTGGWAIDGTILERGRELYFIWSGWPKNADGQQNLYVSRMASPTRLVGPRVLLTTPTQDWERRAMPICEGPQVLQREGKVFVVYSASGSWTADYCLGMLALEGDDVLDAGAWRKVGQVFARNDYACGVGHCGFVTAPDGTDWIFYHAKTRQTPGWADREVRAQPFYWTQSAVPSFGAPGPKRVSEAGLKSA